jgi:hypothetical protein
MVATIGGTPTSFAVPPTTLSDLWNSEAITFIATSMNTVISFGGSGGAVGQTYYLGLDDVSLSAGPLSTEVSLSAVPLPAALPLFATGLGALGLLGLRRKRKLPPDQNT